MPDIRTAKNVSVEQMEEGSYPSLAAAPFHPSESFPEQGHQTIASTPNSVYALVRNALAHIGLDAARFGTADWNPLGDLVKPGARIVLKPNWVLHRNQGEGGWECLITHPSVLRAVIDYAMLTKPTEILIGDAPLQGCDFPALLSLGYQKVFDYAVAAGAPLRVVDFRRTTLQRAGFGVDVREGVKPLSDYCTIDLAERSLLEPISADAKKFRVTMYDPRKMMENHRPGRHRYLVARDILQANLVINLPKLKTHKKSGITGALKNLVGINGNKDYLPHHRKGWPAVGGDNYPSFSVLKAMAEGVTDLANRHLHDKVFYRWCHRLVYALLVLDMKLGGSGDIEGSWHGNDTIWRTCLDLNRLLLYSDVEGLFHEQPQRACLTLIDAVVAGEGEGPLKPEPRRLGAIVGALNPAAADWISALLLGFEPRRIPIVSQAFMLQDMPLALFPSEFIDCRWNGCSVTAETLKQRMTSPFKASVGWRRHIEEGETPDEEAPLPKDLIQGHKTYDEFKQTHKKSRSQK
ncbi:MAG TPA: hypothetical protein DCZ95_01580 [Verrucomicrobia bacterium]|nr:MAG: hypothetical protein A2X46_08685 [Lentisphaerae bacterium GWF2_57_35]HBA82760.1 hypothetical protein [Verrucomicrobiota bacterium]